MEFISRIKELINSAMTYVELKIKELKLEVAEKAAALVADITGGFALLFFGLMFIFFISLWAALFLNNILNSSHLGFLIVAFSWLIAGLIIFTMRKTMIKKPVRNWMTERIMKSETSRE